MAPSPYPALPPAQGGGKRRFGETTVPGRPYTDRPYYKDRSQFYDLSKEGGSAYKQGQAPARGGAKGWKRGHIPLDSDRIESRARGGYRARDYGDRRAVPPGKGVKPPIDRSGGTPWYPNFWRGKEQAARQTSARTEAVKRAQARRAV